MENVARTGSAPPMAGEACGPPPRPAALSEPDATALAQTFAPLADPARLRLLSMIAAQPGGEVCACALAEPLGKSQPTVSHHLKVLFNVGLVDKDKRGTWVWYRVVPERLAALQHALALDGVPVG
jgi:ArsR family transcriptional regulator